MEGAKFNGQWKVPSLVANGSWRKNIFSPFPTFPPTILLKPSILFIFSFYLKVLLYHGPRPLLTHFLPFPRFINHNCASQCNKSSTPSLSIWFWLKHWFFCFPWSYGIAHGHILRASSRTSEWRTASGVISRFHPKPPRASYYYIFSNSCILVILLQVDLASDDKPETICEGCYETENISIFAWFSVPSIGHYRWLRDSICRLLPNSKANYLIRMIHHILYFLQLWTITMVLPKI
jgi:hypothetical protein